MIFNMKYLLLCFLFLLGCSNNSVLIKTDKNFNSDLNVGWGPTSVISGKIVGSMKYCRVGEDMDKELLAICKAWMQGDNDATSE